MAGHYFPQRSNFGLIPQGHQYPVAILQPVLHIIDQHIKLPLIGGHSLHRNANHMVKGYAVETMQHHSHIQHIPAIDFSQKIFPGKQPALNIRIFLNQLDDFLPNFQGSIHNQSCILGQKFRKHGLTMLVVKHIKGQYFCLIRLANRSLTVHIKVSDGVYFIIKELNTVRLMAVHRENVHNATPNPKFSLHFHLISALITHFHQVFQQVLPLYNITYDKL